MNKSKFLKKSLAMLLALMLVVAMIPLSAAAATELPDLTKLYIDTFAINAENGTFESNVADDATQITLRAEQDSMGMVGGTTADLYVVKPDSSATLPIVDKSGTTPNYTKGATVKFSEGWATETEEGYELTLRVSSGSVYEDYKVVLNKVVPSATTNLQNANKGKGVYEVQVNNASKMVSLTVPKDFPFAGEDAQFTVETQDGAEIRTSGGGSATVTGPNSFGVYTISVDALTETFTVDSDSDDVHTTWTISVNAVDNLTAFSLGDYEGTINQATHTVTVEVPRADLYNEYGKLQHIATTVNYDTYDLQSTITIDGAKYADGAAFVIPVADDAGNLIDEDNGIVLNCAGIDGVQKYNLVVKVVESSSTAIKSALFKQNASTPLEYIETVDGTTISAVLPNGTTLNDLRVILYTDKADHVKSISGFEKNGNTDEFIDGMDSWVSYKGGSDFTIDLSKDRIITVTAENGKTQTYTLSASLAETKTEATIKSIYLRDENGVSYEGSVTNNTITFNNIPYMTLDVNDWYILYTPDSQNTSVSVNGGTAVISGQTKASVLNFKNNPLSTEVGKNIVEKKLVAVNKNDASVKTEYDVIINLAGPTRKGKTLTNLEISLQNTNPEAAGTTNAEVYDRVTAYNTIKADDQPATITIEDDDAQQDRKGTITLKPAYSLYKNGTWTNLWDQNLYGILTEIETDGVAFLTLKQGGYDYAVEISSLEDNLKSFTKVNNLREELLNSDNWKIVVLPEDSARKVNATAPGSYGVTIADNLIATGTVYSFDVKPQNPLATGTIESISVKGTPLKVEADTDLVGTLPYGVTAAINDTPDMKESKGTFIDFELTDHARLRVTGTDGKTYWLRDGGDTDDDGVANDPRNDNLKVLFVREPDHKVSVYISNTGAGGAFTTKAAQIAVVAENGTSRFTYKLDKLTWAEPNTDPLITAFSIDGYTGAINGENITVTLPYGTDLKGLVPTFTTSSGATVSINDESVISGQTFVNFTHPVELLVTAEDEQHTKPYTVTVKLDEAFKDVKPGDWFFEDVMQAASAGIVKGQGDGIFAPKDNVTRRDFAIMLSRVLGVDLEGDAVVPFVDVKPDDYGIVAIAYCASHGIVNGYEDTTFRPNEYITRQEAAKMISVAMGVSTISDEKYPDDATIADWASDYVYMAKAAGLMKGDADTGNFRPTSKITRAEAATVMMNAYNQ